MAADPILTRFGLLEYPENHRVPLEKLVKNGLYYLTVSNPVSALVAFSSAASYIYSLQQDAPPSGDERKRLETTMKVLLGYVDKLQEETKNIRGGGKEKTKEEKDDWDEECEALGCEEDPSKLKLTFADVIGMEKEKEMIFSSIVYPIVYPNLYTKTAKGVLLYGPPGTGKTYLIKAAIKELSIKFEKEVGVHFFPLTGADLKGKYVGETEKKIVRAYTCAARRACQTTDIFNLSGPKKCKRVKDVVDRLRETYDKDGAKMWWKDQKQYVSVIFIDEFDAIGGDRSKDETGMVANAVNTLLQMMDGVAPFTNIITVCATNYPWNLDAALIRRFSSQIYCNVPNYSDVVALVRYDMKSRLKYIEDNKQSYCATKINKVFTASDELKEAYPGVEEKAKGNKLLEKVYKEQEDARIKQRDKKLIELFDTSYIKDRSNQMISLFSKMTEDRYSNSDIAQMMQLAYNSVSASALSQSTWLKVPFVFKATETSPEELYDFYVPTKLTKFNTKNENHAKLLQSLKSVENDASIDTLYTAKIEKYPQARKADLYFDQSMVNASSFLLSLFGDYNFATTLLTKQSLKDKTVLKDLTALKCYNALRYLELAEQNLRTYDAELTDKINELTNTYWDMVDANTTPSQTEKEALRQEILQIKEELLQERLTEIQTQLISFFSFVGKVQGVNYLSAKDVVDQIIKEMYKNIYEADGDLQADYNRRVATQAPTPAPTVATTATTTAARPPVTIPAGQPARQGETGPMFEVDGGSLEEIQSGGAWYNPVSWFSSEPLFGKETVSSTTSTTTTQYANKDDGYKNFQNDYRKIRQIKNKIKDKALIVREMKALVAELAKEKSKTLLKEDYETWKAKQSTVGEVTLSDTLILPEGLILDKASARSALGGTKQLYLKGDELEEVTLPVKGRGREKQKLKLPRKKIPVDEKLATSILFNGNKFVNIKFLSSCAPILMFNDVTISDLFYNPVEVEAVNRALQSAKRGEKYDKDMLISVVFSKSYDISYHSIMGREGYLDKLKELEGIMNTIENEFGNPNAMPPATYSIYYQVDRTSKTFKAKVRGTNANTTTTTLQGVEQYPALGAEPEEPENVVGSIGVSMSSNENWARYETARRAYESNPRHRAQKLNKEFYEMLSTIDAVKYYTFDNGTPEDKIQQSWDEWDEAADDTNVLLDPNQKAYRYNKQRVNPAWDYANLILQKGITDKDKLTYADKKMTKLYNDFFPNGQALSLGTDKVTTYTTTIKQKLKELEDYDSFIQFLTDSELAKVIRFQDKEINAENVDDAHKDTLEFIKKVYESIHAKEIKDQPSIFELDDEKEGKKILYFHATIKPFSASWVAFRSSGEYGAIGGFFVNNAKTGVGLMGTVPTKIARGWEWLRSWGKDKKISAEEAEVIATQNVAERIAEAKITTAKYLLARTTAVGITGGQDDSLFYQYVDYDRLEEDLVKEAKTVTAIADAETTLAGREENRRRAEAASQTSSRLATARRSAFATLYDEKGQSLPDTLREIQRLLNPPAETDTTAKAITLRALKEQITSAIQRIEALRTNIVTPEQNKQAELDTLSQTIEAAYDRYVGITEGRIDPITSSQVRVGGGTRSQKKHKKDKSKTRKQKYSGGELPGEGLAFLAEKISQIPSFIMDTPGYKSMDIKGAIDPSMIVWHYLRPENRFPKKIGQAIGSAALIGASIALSILVLTGVGAFGLGIAGYFGLGATTATAAAATAATATTATAAATTVATTSTLMTMLGYLGFVAKAGAIGALAGTANVGLAAAGRRAGLLRQEKTSIILEDTQRLFFNDFIGMFYAFQNPEDDLNFINLMFAVVFGDSSLEIETGRDKKDAQLIRNFPLIYEGLYEKALNRRVRPWYAQMTEYSVLTPENIGYLNLKKVETGPSGDYRNYLCFYMDVSFIASAIKAYPSTYNAKTGGMLEKYNKDRVKFLEELAKKDEKGK